jgi:pilus assembly protein Flp/PilA
MFFDHSNQGQGLVEYALILALVALIVIAVAAIMGPGVANMFSNVVANI